MAWKTIATIGLFAVGAPALAQQSGPPAPPAPGSVDSTAAARNTRDQQEGFNRIVNEGVPVTNAEDKRQAARKKAGPVAAVEADLVAGAAVRDRNGVQVALIEQIEEDGAVVRAGERLAKLPLDAFGKDEAGLMIAITAAEFQAAIAQTSIPAQPEPVEPEYLAATTEDMTPGAAIRDSEGVQIATVDRLGDGGVIILTDGRKVKLALESFAKDANGLLIGITAAEFKAIIGGSASTGG